VIKIANYCQYCGNKLEMDARFCPACGTQIKEILDSIDKTQPAQLSEPSRPADPSNPYEIDNPNSQSQSHLPLMGSGINHSDDDIGLAVGAALMFGMGRRIYRRRRRRAFFYQSFG
jgi:hypothetical protein